MNDGYIKVTTNKFKLKYLRQDKINLIRSFYVKSQSIALISNTTFWWALETQTEWVIFELARTHHLSLKAQNFEKPIFTFRCSLWKQYIILTSYKDFCKLQSFYLCTPVRLYFLGIWNCTEYVAVSNSSCIAWCNLTKLFTFSFIKSLL